jgi:hypothetical protein
MRTALGWGGIAVLVLLLLLSGSSDAGIQVQRHLGELDVEGWLLCAQEGKVYLVELRWAGRKGVPKTVPNGWTVSSPTLSNPTGWLLAADPADASPYIHSNAGKGEHAHWGIEVQERILPKRYGGGLKEGKSGLTFKLRRSGGKFDGWYVAAEKLSAEQEKRLGREPVLRALKLERDPKQAVGFTYFETLFEVTGK